MGKLLDNYMTEYKAAIAPGLTKGHDLVIPPELWIYFRWEQDAGVRPWDKDKHRKALTNAMLQDPEFGQVLTAGMERAMAMCRNMEGQR